MRFACMLVVGVWFVVRASGVAHAQGAAVAPPMNRLPPEKVYGLPPVTDIDAGRWTTCAVAKGEVWCWGRCDLGHCGGPGKEAEPKPRKVGGLRDVVQVSVAPTSACALHKSGAVSCWGHGDSTLFGREGIVRPQRVRGLPRSTQLSHGPGYACALGADSRVRCWGNNYDGVLGQGPVLEAKPPSKYAMLDERSSTIARTGKSSRKPLVVPGLTDVLAIAAGDSHACAVRRDGTVACWGAAYIEQHDDRPSSILRDGSIRDIELPARAVAVNAGDRDSCAVLADGKLSCWNYYTMNTAIVGPRTCNVTGTVQGIDDHAWYARLTSGDLARVVWSSCDHSSIEAGVPPAVENSGTCARTANGEVWCWGTNEHAQLGRPAQPFYKRVP